MYKVSCPITGTRYFERFETLSDEGSRSALLEAWATPEQRAYNAQHDTCQTCKGRGYEVRRYTDRAGRTQTERDNCGCRTCLGTGAVPLMWPSRA